MYAKFDFTLCSPPKNCIKQIIKKNIYKKKSLNVIVNQQIYHMGVCREATGFAGSANNILTSVKLLVTLI